MFQTVTELIRQINTVVWGIPMIASILGVGLILSIALMFLPLRRIGTGFRLLWRGRKVHGEGDISGFSALMTSLSATVGTGNIAGVSTAIAIGGPGALFWMWVTALVGMATKYSEAVCAVHYRETDRSGKHIGGPMYYIKNGLGENWQWLGFLFALFGAVAALGIGNMVQSNAIADALNDKFALPPLLTAGVLIVLIGVAVIGGIKRIGSWADKLVPFMIIAYVLAGMAVLLINAAAIPSAFKLIIAGAFTDTAASGGFVGASVWAALQFGVARGIFSNEAGLGSAPIAHAAAQTYDPVRQGHIAMMGTFIDTLIVCTITGLVIVTAGVWDSGMTSVRLTSTAFRETLPGGDYIVTITLIVFAFTTILGWSYYGERCWQYIFGFKSTILYKVIWLAAIFVGPWALTWQGGMRSGIDFIWLLSDTLNALMALPNLVALLLLMPVIVKLTRRKRQ